ncbi:MAG: iron donor protein CyaY [Myxococcales bacterium]|nr:iron donor protein CyaY [Myxococcales bacterium]
MDQVVTERQFEQTADRTLTALQAALDALSLDCEVELSMGILTVEFPDGTKYVVNSHRAAKQIWMAAEREAWHFDPGPNGWVAAKSGDELVATISRVLTKKLGTAVALRV